MAQFIKLFLLLSFLSSALTLKASEESIGTEKCYCVSLIGQNDGGDNGGKGSAKENYSCNDWLEVAKGTCLDMGGSLVKGQAPKK